MPHRPRQTPTPSPTPTSRPTPERAAKAEAIELPDMNGRALKA
jgi:hypothetical protein